MENIKRYYGADVVLPWRTYRLIESEKKLRYYDTITIIKASRRLLNRGGYNGKH